jgi:hypothetical protein
LDVAVEVVPVASKNTDSGATPLIRVVLIETEIVLVFPVDVLGEDATVTIMLWLAVPPGPAQVTL